MKGLKIFFWMWAWLFQFFESLGLRVSRESENWKGVSWVRMFGPIVVSTGISVLFFYFFPHLLPTNVLGVILGCLGSLGATVKYEKEVEDKDGYTLKEFLVPILSGPFIVISVKLLLFAN